MYASTQVRKQGTNYVDVHVDRNDEIPSIPVSQSPQRASAAEPDGYIYG